MSSYTELAQGDRLPTVGVLQSLLNRSGASLKVDGVFGGQTKNALIEFQWQRELKAEGVADKETWQRLMFKDPLPLVDLADCFDEIVSSKVKTMMQESGGDPIILGGMSNGLVQMGRLLSAERSIFLLRIIGHGGPGVQAISMGRGGWLETVPNRVKPVIHWFPHETTSMSTKNIAAFPAQIVKRTFGPYASVELHGCHVAAGAKGRTFVTRLANLLGVPVSAGTGSQQDLIFFDGPTFTAIPHGKSLKDWCARLPPFTPMTVP